MTEMDKKFLKILEAIKNGEISYTVSSGNPYLEVRITPGASHEYVLNFVVNKALCPHACYTVGEDEKSKVICEYATEMFNSETKCPVIEEHSNDNLTAMQMFSKILRCPQNPNNKAIDESESK